MQAQETGGGELGAGWRWPYEGASVLLQEASFPELGTGRVFQGHFVKGAFWLETSLETVYTVPVSRCVSDGALIFSLQREGKASVGPSRVCHPLG